MTISLCIKKILNLKCLIVATSHYMNNYWESVVTMLNYYSIVKYCISAATKKVDYYGTIAWCGGHMWEWYLCPLHFMSRPCPQTTMYLSIDSVHLFVWQGSGWVYPYRPTAYRVPASTWALSSRIKAAEPFFRTLASGSWLLGGSESRLIQFLRNLMWPPF